jgi:hypothetical protein
MKILQLETNKVLWEGANLHYADLYNADLRYADLSYADLCNANLYNADLYGANLHGANLSGANLRYADLSGANLRNADLRNAKLRYADLGNQWIIQGPVRSDGYHFLLMRLTGEKVPKVRAGCRWYSLAGAKAHWSRHAGSDATRRQLNNEALDILIWLERAMHYRGLK